MMEGLNRIPVDFVCFGNHEFDLPAPVLQKRISEFQVFALHAAFPPPPPPPAQTDPRGPLEAP